MGEYRGQTYPEPREGITGTARTGDDLLSLEDEAIPRRSMMIAVARHLRDATLVGQPAPVVRRMSERMRQPQPGDLVVETSVALRGRTPDSQVKGFGILIAHRQEWWDTDEEWAAQVEQERASHEEFLRSSPYAQPGDADEPWEPDERITDHAWYVQYGPAEKDVCRWVNCEFMAIPVDGDFALPAGTRDGTGVTLTRNDLVGSLADSGFTLKQP